MDPSQSLVSVKSSDSGLHIQLHPLVLLTISDHITRHVARQQQGPIIGALLGQQNGREITLEHVFECPVTLGENGEFLLTSPWFEERLKQCTYNRAVKPTITIEEARQTDTIHSQRRSQRSRARPCWMVVNCTSFRPRYLTPPSPQTDPPRLQRVSRLPRIPPLTGPITGTRRQAAIDNLRDCA